jgi:hypothetical protein
MAKSILPRAGAIDMGVCGTFYLVPVNKFFYHFKINKLKLLPVFLRTFSSMLVPASVSRLGES